MITAYRIFSRTMALWWENFISLTIINIVWMFFQTLIVTAPPATAAIYAAARQMADEELIEPGYSWIAFKKLFIPAWKWGLANLVIYGVILGNFYAYQDAVGPLWTILRTTWNVIAFLWFTANLFYWPFYTAQSDHSMLTTYRNSFLLTFKRPAMTLTLGFICSIMLVSSIIIIVPMVGFTMTWIAAIGIQAVDIELKDRAKQEQNPMEQEIDG